MPFVINGKTYMDEKQSSPAAEHRQVYMLDKDRLKTICEFEVRPDNYVLSLSSRERVEKAAGSDNPWVYAISQPGIAALEALIQGGRDVNEVTDTEHGLRPLHLAMDRVDLLEILLKAGANPNLKKKEEFMTLLAEAVWRGNNKTVELLLKYGAKANEPVGYNALVEAIDRGTVEKLELLLRYGTEITDAAAVQAITARGNEDKYEKLKLLLAHGLDVNRLYTKDEVVEGIKQLSPGVWSVGPDFKTQKVTKTLLQWARESGDPETVRILIKAGAKKSDKGLLHKLKEADTELNQNYRSLTSSLNETDRKKLQSEQRSWIHDRDAKCGSFHKGGSKEDWLRNAAANDKRALCVLEVILKRTTALSMRLLIEVVPPGEKAQGHSQVEWSQKYWKWSKSFPKGSSPADDTSGIHCGENQSQAVWFLTGSNNSAPVVRNCEIPSQRHIFLPVLVSLLEVKNQDYECGRLLTMLDVATTGTADIRVEIDGKVSCIQPFNATLAGKPRRGFSS